MAKLNLVFSQEMDKMNALENGTLASYDLSGNGILVTASAGQPAIVPYKNPPSGPKETFLLEHPNKPAVQRRFTIGYDLDENDQLYVGTVDIDGSINDPLGTDLQKYELENDKGVVIRAVNGSLEVYPIVIT